jgi:hypothetical protein
LLTTKAFSDWLKNRFVTILGGKSAPLADHWMRHPQRRQFDNIVFAPGRDAGRAYNLWQGFTVEPRPGDCSLFLDHLRENVAQSDDALYLWVVGWLADIVQHPGAKCGTALALRGKKGVGKTIVGKVFQSGTSFPMSCWERLCGSRSPNCERRCAVCLVEAGLLFQRGAPPTADICSSTRWSRTPPTAPVA